MSKYAPIEVIELSSLVLAYLLTKNQLRNLNYDAIAIELHKSTLKDYKSTYNLDARLTDDIIEITKWLLTVKPSFIREEDFQVILLAAYEYRKNLDSNLRPISGLKKIFRGAMFQNEPENVIGRVHQAKENIASVLSQVNQPIEKHRKQYHRLIILLNSDALHVVTDNYVKRILGSNNNYSSREAVQLTTFYFRVWLLARSTLSLEKRLDFIKPNDFVKNSQLIILSAMGSLHRSHESLRRTISLEKFFDEYRNAYMKFNQTEFSDEKSMYFDTILDDIFIMDDLNYSESCISDESREIISIMSKKFDQEISYDYGDDIIQTFR